ncbi:putative transcriptional regulator [Owenweeksia hongkongensis DSM 17368]|uniref:Putative transcriptional regulator n=1 Tax=Owenweeksia hongkongensis (strain DSM 17368 / CIP 108786 / JCM 12287 / NRRL B-23963 / UST20020801) TaxID=926562 RepID=G8R876_OWEHD|nr:helix-turn-helix transcriptional regulator [Owenweeksia hongkongensis]AEV32444.1 putative transcriptional regulator [Owenweeksia hongkongensis DSM 17368]
MNSDFEFLLSFGKSLRDRRIKKNLSQEKLAAEAGLHRTYIGALERGEKNVSLLNLKRLADTFGIELHELLNFNA